MDQEKQVEREGIHGSGHGDQIQQKNFSYQH